MSEKALLEVKDLKTYFYTEEGVTPAVDGLSFTLQDGGTLAIVGESGCGKSVTSLSILRIFPSPPGKIVGGDILYKGESLLKKSEKEMRKIRGNEISMIFQEPLTSLNPVFTVGQQICETLKMHQGLNKKQAREKGIEMLKKVGIPTPEKVIDDYPHQLSGGMRQRVMIAMALACEPDILIADEPTTALDVTIQAQILELMQALQKKMGMAIIMITHDLGVIASMCDEVIVMYAGSVCERGTADNIFYRPRHEYTRGLLRSIPNIDIDEKERLVPISGTPIDLLCMPSGCAFAPRCERAMKICLEGRAPEVFVGKDHISACWMNVKEGMERNAIEYDGEGRIVRMNLDGGAGA